MIELYAAWYVYEMSVKMNFATHLIPGLFRSYAAPTILQIFEIR